MNKTPIDSSTVQQNQSIVNQPSTNNIQQSQNDIQTNTNNPQPSQNVDSTIKDNDKNKSDTNIPPQNNTTNNQIDPKAQTAPVVSSNPPQQIDPSTTTPQVQQNIIQGSTTDPKVFNVSSNLIYSEQQIQNATNYYGKQGDPEYEEYKRYIEQRNLYKDAAERAKIIEDHVSGSKLSYERNLDNINEKSYINPLQKQGLLSLTVPETSESTLNYYFGLELGSKSGQKICIQFLAYKPLTFTTYSRTQIEKIPKRLKFEFKFWNSNDIYRLIGKVNIPEESVLMTNQPLEIISETSAVIDSFMDKRIYTEILYDPSIEVDTDFKEFISYLLTRHIIVDVIDLDKSIKIGVIKIPLKDLLRSGKKKVVTTKEYEIYNNTFDVKGYIQVLLENSAVDTKHSFIYNENNYKVVNALDSSNKKIKKRHIVRPFDTSQLSTEQKEKIGQMMIIQNTNFKGVNFRDNDITRIKKFNIDPMMEKKLRVMRFLNTQNPIASNKMQLEEDRVRAIKKKKEDTDKFYSNLNYISKLRELGKDSILSKVTVESNKSLMNTSIILGQPKYINYIIRNDAETNEIFHIIISESNSTEVETPVDPKDKTISIINSPEQWAEIVEKFKLQVPSDYNIIDHDNYIQMLPGESVPLVIRILSYKELVKDKAYTIFVHKGNGQSLFFFTIVIRNCISIVDHVFYYNEPCNKVNDLIIPNPFKSDPSKTSQILQNSIITNFNVNLEVDKKTHNFKFKFTTKENGFTDEFYIYFYLQNQRYFLYMTWKFIINAINYLEFSINLGSKRQEQITMMNILPEGEAKNLKLYSENSNLVFFSEEDNEPFTLLSQQSITKKLVIFPRHYKDTKCMVNCVDSATGELFMSWLIKIYPQKPKIDEICIVDCKIGAPTNFSYKFSNESNAYVVLNFESENEDFLKVIDNKMLFNTNETKIINMIAHSSLFYSKVEVMVYVYDDKEIYSKIILFQLNYK